MKAEQFIDLLEERELLSARSTEKLRKQLGSRAQEMSGRALAKLLISKGHLTKHQAKKILAEAEANELAAEEPQTHPSVSQVGLAPLEEEELKLAADAEELVEADDEDAVHEEALSAEIEQSHLQEISSPSEGLLGETDLLQELSGASEAESGGQPDAGGNSLLDDPLLAKVGGEPEGNQLRSTGKKKSRKRRKHAKLDKNKSEWESPLMLVGGGGLVLLLLVGGLVYYLLNRDSGDAMLEAAAEQFKSGSYTQAIATYTDFTKQFPKHVHISKARVQLAMAKIRKAAPEGMDDATGALEVAKVELDRAASEESFHEVQSDVAALLERISKRLSEQAFQEKDPEKSLALSAKTKEALLLLNNRKYVPKTLQPTDTVDEINQTLAVVERRQQRAIKRASALQAITQAIEKKDIRTAYDSYRDLLKEHPEFANDSKVQEVVAKIAAVERSSIKFVEETKKAITQEANASVLATLAVANVEGGKSSLQGISVLQIDGAHYGIDRTTGHLLWRRFTGFVESGEPLLLGDTTIGFDSNRQELFCVSTQNGKLQWRQEIGEQAFSPVLFGKNVLLATTSGKMFSIDAATGDRLGYVKLAQSPAVAPFVDSDNGRVCVVGEHSSVYVLVGEKLLCKDVFHLGHRAGTIRVRPVGVMNHIVVAENYGEQTSRIHVLSFQQDSTLTQAGKPVKIQGYVMTKISVDGRKFAVISDMGEIIIMETAPGAAGKISWPIAARAAAGKIFQRHIKLSGSKLWVAGNRLDLYTIITSGNRLRGEELSKAYEGSIFDGAIDQSLMVRRPPNSLGVVIAPLPFKNKLSWQTQIAAPPAGKPIVDTKNKSLLVATQSGSIFALSQKELRERIQNKSLSNARRMPSLSHGTPLANGSAVFSEVSASGQLLTVTRNGTSYALKTNQLPGTLIAEPVAYAGGLLCPIEAGQVLLVDPNSGKVLATPFQPTLKAGEAVIWSRPTLSPDGKQFVIADTNSGKIYVVSLDTKGKATLKLQSVNTVPIPKLVHAPVLFGKKVLVLSEEGTAHLLNSSDMTPAGTIKTTAPIAWGPYRVADKALFATQQKDAAPAEMWCIDAQGEKAWSVKLLKQPPIGMPLVIKDRVVVALSHGGLLQLALGGGATTGTLETEQPAGAGPVLFQGKILLPTYDGAIQVVQPF